MAHVPRKTKVELTSSCQMEKQRYSLSCISDVNSSRSESFHRIYLRYCIIVSCWGAWGKNAASSSLHLKNKEPRLSFHTVFGCLFCPIFSTSCLFDCSRSLSAFSPTTRKNRLWCVLLKDLFFLRWWHTTSTFSRSSAYIMCQVVKHTK